MEAQCLKAVSCTESHIESLLLGCFSHRLKLHGIWLEFIRSLVRIVKDLIIEVKVKTQNRIRHSHLQDRLMDLHKLALIRSVHLNRRIKILRRRRYRTKSQRRRQQCIYIYSHNHIFYSEAIISSSFLRRSSTLSLTSSSAF